jgi:YVTN family beta-propeller protein
MALSPDGTRLYYTSGISEVSVLDTANGHVVQRIEVGSRVRYTVPPARPWMVLSPDGRLLHVLKMYGNTDATSSYAVATVDTTALAALPTEAAVFCTPGSSLLLPLSGRKMAILCTSKAEIQFLQLASTGAASATSTLRLTNASPTGVSRPLAGSVSQDERTMFVATSDGQIVEIDVEKQSVSRIVRRLDAADRQVLDVGIVQSPDGARLYVCVDWRDEARDRRQEVLVIDTQTGQQLATIEVSIRAGLAASSDGRYLYAPGATAGSAPAVARTGEIVVIDIVRGRQSAVIEGVGRFPASLLVAP